MGRKMADLVLSFKQQVANIFKVPVEMFTTARAIKNAKPLAYMWEPGPLTGRDLDNYAEQWFSIGRQPGETDEQLHRRCIDTLCKAYEGALVVPHDDLREYLEAAISKEKQGVIRNE